MNIIKWLVSLPPRNLNIALLALGVAGMIWAYNKGQERIGELEDRIALMQRETKIERDSLFRVAQQRDTECNERVLAGQTSLIDRLDALNGKLNEKLDQRDDADSRRLKQAVVNNNAAKTNTKNLRKLNEKIENTYSTN